MLLAFQHSKYGTEIILQANRARIATQTYIHKPSGRINLIYPMQDAADEVEEVVLSLQGYAVTCNLPPITSKDQ